MRDVAKKSMVAYYEEFGDCDKCGSLCSMYMVPKFNRKRCSTCGSLAQSKPEDKARLVHGLYRDDVVNTKRG